MCITVYSGILTNIHLCVCSQQNKNINNLYFYKYKIQLIHIYTHTTVEIKYCQVLYRFILAHIYILINIIIISKL